MILHDDNDYIIVDDNDNVLFATPVEITVSDQYYYGVIEAATRPVVADFSALTKVEQSSNVSQHSITYPETVGWYIFAEPLANPLRTRWLVFGANKGDIGGSADDFDPNLFPDPVQFIHEGIVYRLYISSYQTLLTLPITFRT